MKYWIFFNTRYCQVEFKCKESTISASTLYKSSGDLSFPKICDLQSSTNGNNHPTITETALLNHDAVEMDDEDMELYGGEESAAEMDIDVTKSSSITEPEPSQEKDDSQDTFWTIMYGEEGWLRVIPIIINFSDFMHFGLEGIFFCSKFRLFAYYSF